MRKVLVTAVFVSLFNACFSQSLKDPGIKVFIDCNAWCDFSFIKTEINYIDFVPDRFSSNVYILLTTQRTGSGGQEINLYFTGQESFKGMVDTLTFNRSSIATDDEYRNQLVRYLKLGLTRYIAKSSLAEKLNIKADVGKGEEPLNATSNKKDPWNFWVFNAGINANLDGSDNYTSSNIRFQFSAGRVTEKLKINFTSSINNTKNKYIYNDYDSNTGAIIFSDTTRSNTKRTNINGNLAISLSDHWSAGLFASFYTSTFSNIQKSLGLKPAIEYSVFPYKTSTTKYIGFLYRIGPLYNDYVDITWRNKPDEWLLQQSASFDMNFTQKWGSVFTTFYWSNYFFDWKWHNYGFFGNGQFRIAKGLSLNFFGGFGIIHDQVELPKGNATQTQVLIRQRILKNTFEYFTGFGINYRFGSIFNNVVNPRLGEAGQNGFFIMN